MLDRVDGPRPRFPAQAMVQTQGPARTKAVNRNAKRLLVYVLDVSATLAQNQVVIDLARRQRKTTGEWGPLRPWYYAPHAAHVKYDPEDRLILALLDEAQGGTAQGVYSTPALNSGSATWADKRHWCGTAITAGRYRYLCLVGGGASRRRARITWHAPIRAP